MIRNVSKLLYNHNNTTARFELVQQLAHAQRRKQQLFKCETSKQYMFSQQPTIQNRQFHSSFNQQRQCKDEAQVSSSIKNSKYSLLNTSTNNNNSTNYNKFYSTKASSSSTSSSSSQSSSSSSSKKPNNGSSNSSSGEKKFATPPFHEMLRNEVIIEAGRFTYWVLPFIISGVISAIIILYDNKTNETTSYEVSTAADSAHETEVEEIAGDSIPHLQEELETKSWIGTM